MLGKLRRLAEISPAEWVLVAQFAIFALAVRLCLTRTSLLSVIQWLTRWTEHPILGRVPLLQRRYPLPRLTRLVDIATAITQGQGRCLARSLLLLWMLKIRHEPVQLLIGVNKQADELRGHAWIETPDGIVLDTPETIGGFAPVLRF